MAYDFSWTCSIKPSKRELKVHEGPENKKIGISPISRRTVFGRQSKRTPQSLEYRLNRTNFAHSNPDKMKKRPPFRRGECGIFRLIFSQSPFLETGRSKYFCQTTTAEGSRSPHKLFVQIRANNSVCGSYCMQLLSPPEAGT